MPALPACRYAASDTVPAQLTPPASEPSNAGSERCGAIADGSHSDQTGPRYPQFKNMEHLTSRHANRILIEGDPLPVRLTKPRTPKAAK